MQPKYKLLLASLKNFYCYQIQTGGDALPFRSAFKNVIFRRSFSLDIERSDGLIQNKLEQEGKLHSNMNF